MKHSNKESILVKFLRFGLYLTAFIPLIIFKDYISPFHFGKVLLFRSLIEILGVGYLLLILRDRSYLPRFNKIFFSVFFFVLAFSLATATSILPYASFWGFLERMGGLWTFGHYFLFFVILTSVFNKKEHWYNLLNLTIFVGVLSAFYGFGQKTDIKFFIGSGGRERIFGTIGNAALFAGSQLFIVFLSIVMYLRSGSNRNWNVFYSVAFIVSSIAILMTGVRGSILGYAVGLTLFAFLWVKFRASKLANKVFGGLVGLVIIFVVFSLLFGNSSFIKNSKSLSRLTNFSLTTIQTRIWAWQAGIDGWNDSAKTIILGWGPENFNIPFSKHFNPSFFVGTGSETLFDRAHNMFVEMLVTMGVVGLIAYINIFISMFRASWKLLKEKESFVFGAGITSLVVAYVIHNFFIFDTSVTFVIFFTVMGFISYLGLAEKDNSMPTTPIIRRNGIIQVIAVVLFILVSILIYKTNVVPAKANYATTRAILLGRANNFDGASTKFKESLSYDVPGKYEYRHRLAQYLVGVGGPSVKEQKVREFYNFALKEIDKNIKENPVDNFPYLYGSRLNILLGYEDPKSQHNDRALDYAFKALELSPKFVRTYYEIAQAYVNKKDYPKALEFFQKAVELNPGTGLSYWYLGATKIESGDLVGGLKDLEKSITGEYRYSPTEQDYLKLINVYFARKDFTRIAGIYEKLIGKNPKNAQYYASLGTAYANLGRIDEAVAMARKAVEIDPTFEPDARIFVKSLGRGL